LVDLYSEWPRFISTAPEIAYAYVKDYLRLRPDVACTGSTLASIAQKRRIPPFVLERSVDCFNRLVQDGGHSDPWGRPVSSHPLTGSRWVLLGPAKAYFTTTEGGLRINRQFQVLDCHDQPIPGLYAIGQVGLSGQILWGHGLHIAWALTSGYLVGKGLGTGT
ncbi:MAG: FAD-binding protein, partial [Planctomycetaceae bacterium]|nr:FAD-binding protein [Planctomycetaceae bacterium]